jgi:NADH-quinone oxidoreductase chain I
LAIVVDPSRSSRTGEVLKTILLLELWVGLWTTLKNQFRPHVTVEYPKERVDLEPRFRGMPRLRFDPKNGEELCIACHLCEIVCPDECIHIVSEKNPIGKGKRLVSFEINYERCCLCGLCVDPCPTKPLTAIYMSHDYEMADYQRQGFVAPLKALLHGTEPKDYKE